MMSGFKDMVANDRSLVFLDIDTFGERANVEGRDIVIVIDNAQLKQRQGGAELAIADSATLFHARVEDLPPAKSPGESLNINGRECIVDDWTEDMGIATVSLREVIIA